MVKITRLLQDFRNSQPQLWVYKRRTKLELNDGNSSTLSHKPVRSKQTTRAATWWQTNSNILFTVNDLWRDRHELNHFDADRFTAHPLSLWQPHQVISNRSGIWRRQYVPLDTQRRPRSDASTGTRTCQQQLYLSWGKQWEHRNTGLCTNIVFDLQLCAVLLHKNHWEIQAVIQKDRRRQVKEQPKLMNRGKC